MSNLANDYGDTIHGADSQHREGPKRAVQSGVISSAAMRRALIIFAFLAFISGVTLLWVSFGGIGKVFWVFIGLGIMAIAAAITYTAGAKPYGYIGLGDVSVFMFFGVVAVLGSYFLYGQQMDLILLLPATGMGLLSVGVLNVNNIRDIESDHLAGKNSIPVRIGREKAVVYHRFLLVSAVLLTTCYVFINYKAPTQFLFLLSIPLFVLNMRAVKTKVQAKDLDPYLKQLALSILLFVVLFGVGLLI